MSVKRKVTVPVGSDMEIMTQTPPDLELTGRR
jgi:hypothetical protein